MDAIAQHLLDQLKTEFENQVVLREYFPILKNPGVLSGEVHSYVLTHLALLGNLLGYMAVVACPISNVGRREALNRSGQQAKWPDSVWSDRTTGDYLAFFEFEGCTSSADLVNKAQSLLEAYHDAEVKPHLLVLMYWQKPGGDQHRRGFRKIRIDPATAIFRNGFRDEKGYFVGPPTCETVIVKVGMAKREERFWLADMLIVGELVPA